MPILAENALKPDNRMQVIIQPARGVLVVVVALLACGFLPEQVQARAAAPFSPVDSLSAEQRDGSWQVLHEVEAGETLYGLARRYLSTVDLILLHNPDVAIEGLKAGQRVWIPRDARPAAALSQPAAEPEASPTGSGILVSAHPDAVTRPASPETPAPKSAGQRVAPEVQSPDPVTQPPAPQVTSAKPVPALAESAAEHPSGNAPELPDYFWHELEPEETLFSLSRMYRVSLSNLLNANPGLDPHALKTGQRLRIPRAPELENPTEVSVQPQSHPEAAGIFRDTYPATSPGQGSSAVSEATLPSIPAAATIPGAAASPAPGAPAIPPVQANPSADRPVSGLRERGLATWIDATSSPTHAPHLFALYNGVPTGSLITVRNLMNNRSVQVKVVGPMPQTHEDSSAIVKLSKDAALQLQAHDAKVLVEVQASASQP
jgi:LysM repeat protein